MQIGGMLSLTVDIFKQVEQMRILSSTMSGDLALQTRFCAQISGLDMIAYKSLTHPPYVRPEVQELCEMTDLVSWLNIHGNLRTNVQAVV